MRLLDIFFKRNAWPSVIVDGKRIACLVYKVSPKKGEVRIEVGEGGLFLIDAQGSLIDTEGEEQTLSVPEGLLKILPSKRAFDSLGNGIHVSNIDLFIKLYQKGKKDQIYVCDGQSSKKVKPPHHREKVIEDAYNCIKADIINSSAGAPAAAGKKRSQSQGEDRNNCGHNSSSAVEDAIDRYKDGIANHLRPLVYTITELTEKKGDQMPKEEGKCNICVLLEALQIGLENLSEQIQYEKQENEALHRQIEELKKAANNPATPANEPPASTNEALPKKAKEAVEKATASSVGDRTSATEEEPAPQPLLLQEVIRSLNDLAQDLEKGAYLFSSESGEQLRDGLKDMLDRLVGEFGRVKAADDEAAHKRIEELLNEQLQNRASVFNKLACYKAYSQLLAMADANHQGVTYFDSQRIDSLYKRVMDMLSQFGYEHLVPNLLEDRLNENLDRYEEDASGQVQSELENLYGLGYKENLLQGRLGLIMDIAELGFSHKGEIVKKTKVLTVK